MIKKYTKNYFNERIILIKRFKNYFFFKSYSHRQQYKNTQIKIFFRTISDDGHHDLK